jgi:hypothetical protein
MSLVLDGGLMTWPRVAMTAPVILFNLEPVEL